MKFKQNVWAGIMRSRSRSVLVACSICLLAFANALSLRPLQKTSHHIMKYSIRKESPRSKFRLQGDSVGAIGEEGSGKPQEKAVAFPLNFKVPARKTLKKLLPLGTMLFFILFNYTILRDTKDVLVVTAPNSGAEIIPFLKTYVNLPSAVIFTLLYSYLCNRMPADKVFYIVLSAFLSFFAAFAGFICEYLPFPLLICLLFACPQIRTACTCIRTGPRTGSPRSFLASSW